MLQAVIFDHDGVMVDTEPLHSQAWVQILEQYGKTPQFFENGVVHHIGIPIDENWHMLKARYGITESADFLEEQRSVIYRQLLNRTQPMDGLMELLRRLRQARKDKGIRLAIASSSNREYIETVLENFGIADDFDAIVSRKDVPLGKPAPDVYIRAAQLLNVQAESCIVLEDSETGVSAARAAGMKVIAIPNEYTRGQNFAKASLVLPALSQVDLPLLCSCP
jgi:HAD superfamily hydrolase (TIGR01509 family)